MGDGGGVGEFGWEMVVVWGSLGGRWWWCEGVWVGDGGGVGEFGWEMVVV